MSDKAPARLPCTAPITLPAHLARETWRRHVGTGAKLHVPDTVGGARGILFMCCMHGLHPLPGTALRGSHAASLAPKAETKVNRGRAKRRKVHRNCRGKGSCGCHLLQARCLENMSSSLGGPPAILGRLGRPSADGIWGLSQAHTEAHQPFFRHTLTLWLPLSNLLSLWRPAQDTSCAASSREYLGLWGANSP